MRAAPKSSTNNIIMALRAGGGFLESFGKLKALQSEKAEKSGYLLGLSGEKLEENATQAKIRGFQRGEGKAAVLEFGRLTKEYTLRNIHLPPEEFHAGIEQLQLEFLEGKSEDYLEGFVKGALQHENSAISAYTQARHTIVQNAQLNNSTKDFTNTLENGLEDLSETLQSLISTSDEALAPEERDEKAESHIQAFAKEIREAMDAKIAENKALGIPTKVTMERLLETIGHKAVQSANPSLMSFMYLEDSDGIRLIDTDLAKEAYRYLERAENAVTIMENDYIEQQKEYQKEMTKRWTNHFLTEFAALRNNAERVPASVITRLQSWLEEFSDASKNEYGIALEPTMYKQLLNMTNNLSKVIGYAERTDLDTLRELSTMSFTITDEESLTKVLDFLDRNRVSFTKTDYNKSVANAMASYELAENEGMTELKNSIARNQAIFESTVKQLGETIIEQSMSRLYADKIRKQDAKRVDYVRDYLTELVKEATLENGGKAISVPKLREIKEELRDKAYKIYPRVDLGVNKQEREEDNIGNKQRTSSTRTEDTAGQDDVERNLLSLPQ